MMMHETPNGTATRTIALLNQKGGVGKTTTTVNLGAALALAEQRVLLIDLDPQAHLTLHLGIEDDQIEHTVYDLLIDPDVAAADAVIKARPHLDVILSEVDLAGAEPELASRPNRQRILADKLWPIIDRYEVVLLDCPPSLGLMTLNALAAAREVYVPMQAHFLALQGVSKLLETVGLVCRQVNPDLRVTGIVLCMHEHQTTLAKEIVTDLEEFFESARGHAVPWRDCRVLHPPVRRNIKLAEAPSFGQTIFDYSPWCKGAIDYRKLARNLVEHWHRILPAAPTADEHTAPAPAADQAADEAAAPHGATPDTEHDPAPTHRAEPERAAEPPAIPTIIETKPESRPHPEAPAAASMDVDDGDEAAETGGIEAEPAAAEASTTATPAPTTAPAPGNAPGPAPDRHEAAGSRP